MTRHAIVLLVIAAGAAACAGSTKPVTDTPVASASPTPTVLPPLEPIDVPASPGESEFLRAIPWLEDPSRRDDALATLMEAMRLGCADPEAPYDIACLHALAGRQDEAIEWLHNAIEAGWCRDEYARTDETLSGIRGPRFDDALAAMRERAKSGRCWEDPELSAIRNADQADRHGTSIDWPAVRVRDRERRERVLALLSNGRLKTPMDYYNAALVFQHGDVLADYERARSLAYESAKRGYRGGLWLTAAAWDRWLMRAGYPQKFGTQFRCPDGKPCEVLPLDRSTTPEERARWGVPDPAETAKALRAK